MKMIKIATLLSFSWIISSVSQTWADCEVDNTISERSANQLLQLTEQKKAGAKLVKFDYTNESIINIINELAQIQGINILFPIELEKIEFNLTINRPGQIPLHEAWGIINTFLEILEYSIVPKGITYEIVSNKSQLKNEALDTYINIHPDQLPSDDRKVRYLYYLQNINLNSPTGGKGNLENIIRDMLPYPSGDHYKMDLKSNCLILISRTEAIKSIMQIIIALDKEGFREAIEIVPLKHTNASNIVKLLNELIQNKSSSQQFRYAPYGSSAPATNEEAYFAKNTSVVAIERNNAIAIMGKIDSVNKVKNFISKYLDIAIDTNKTIIHTKELQYLEAEDLAKILQRLVKARVDSMQASSSKDALSEVIITAEKTSKADTIKQLDIIKDKDKAQGQPTPDKGNQQVSSSNSIIVAAREPEWQIIEQLINEIDQPQPQIIIETLIVDLTVADNNKLASQLRNMNMSGNPQAFNFQSAQIGGPVLNYTGNPLTPTANGLASDLLSAGQLNKDGQIVNQLAGLVEAGSTLISFNDGEGIAALLSLFKGQSNAKVLSQPFMTTLNHQQTSITLSDKRIVAGSVSQQSTGGPVILKNDTITADLKLDILPRISRSGTVNLEIIVHASEFKNPGSSTDNTILTRKIQTNANVSDQQVLVIGGLTKVTDVTAKSGFPIISRIPIIGNFFKKRSQSSEKTTLMVFISPKIIQPRSHGINEFTQYQLDFAKHELVQGDRIFDNISDPITRIMFNASGQKNRTQVQAFEEKVVFESSKKTGAITKAIQ